MAINKVLKETHVGGALIGSSLQCFLPEHHQRSFSNHVWSLLIMALRRITSLKIFNKLPENLVVRTMASATASDPIQKLFLDKIREYQQKASSTSDGLVDADDGIRKSLAEDAERVKRTYGIADGEEARLNTKFTDDMKFDPIDLKDWKS